MSGFNTKEKNNYGDYEIAFYTDNHEDFKKVQDLCRKLIDHNKPVSTEGDLISREAFRKHYCKINCGERQCVDHADRCNFIDELMQFKTEPERPKGDLISRKALKDITYINKGNFNTVEGIREWIDNAPTAPLPNEQIAWEQGYEAGLAQGKCDRVQGEWIKHIDDLFPEESTEECPFCHEEQLIRLGNDDNFCPNCGADMRKGIAE